VFTGLNLMPATSSDPLQIGEWLVDPRDDTLTRGAEKVKVEPRTMRLLIRLAQTPGAVVSQDELLESVWSGVVVGTASVYQSMSQLRKVLGDTEDPPRYIETVARKGYRLVARVSALRALVPPSGATPGQPGAILVPIERRVLSTSQVAPARPAAHRWRWITLAAIAAIAVAAAVWQFAPRTEPAQAEMASIVVLPFTDLTSGGTDQAFCDGLTEELSNWLAQIPTLHVVARTSAFAFRNRGADVRGIGRELGTSHLLEGSVRRSGDQMRITVQLIDTRTGYHLWSRTFPVEAGDVLLVQEQVARAVADNLEIRMTAETDSRFESRRSKNAEAQNLYLIAKSHEAKLDSESNEQAITLYRRAIEADPSFALAKVWLAHAISNRRYFNNEPIEKLQPEIEALLVAAEKSAPQLVDLYVVRGQFRNQLRQREAALTDLRHALELSPNSLAAASALAYYHLTNGEPRDALTYYTIASALDPRAFGLHAYRCMALSQLAQFAAAEAACERARALEPESPMPYMVSSGMEAGRGNLVEALKWSDAALQRGSDIADIHGDRAEWLLSLELVADAGTAYQNAVIANAEAARQNAALVFVGSAAAIEHDGAKGLQSFIRESGAGESDNPKLMFELANSELMVGGSKLANDYVTRALASPMLAAEDITSPWLASYGRSYLLITAATLRANGDAAGAERRLNDLAVLLDRLVDAGVQTRGLYELKAQLAAMRGQGDAAMAALQRAVELGWSEVWLAEHQPYFESLRARPDYHELLGAARAKNAATAAKLRTRLLTVRVSTH
jgi:TolB-like protein/DNA-binding winged helix-turn-helix (wHTH) protein/Tfp pilus assembly protein PilF